MTDVSYANRKSKCYAQFPGPSKFLHLEPDERNEQIYIAVILWVLHRQDLWPFIQVSMYQTPQKNEKKRKNQV